MNLQDIARASRQRVDNLDRKNPDDLMYLDYLDDVLAWCEVAGIQRFRSDVTFYMSVLASVFTGHGVEIDTRSRSAFNAEQIGVNARVLEILDLAVRSGWLTSKTGAKDFFSSKAVYYPTGRIGAIFPTREENHHESV